jgi:ArsR family transcriptional regulator, lead/cadmium/zinc/bismuth-responsive transcriptional repressor
MMSTREPGDEPTPEQTECVADEHPPLPSPRYDDAARERAASLFRALGDEARLRTLEMLVGRDACVSELAEASGEQISTVSHRLRLLRSEGLVNRRREGRHIYYSLADKHVFELIQNALEHASE